jgi:hypothetical protein
MTHVSLPRRARRTALCAVVAASTVLVAAACQPDTDKDGYTDAAETAVGWNPNSTDQDANGIKDNVQDLDADGLNWWTEVHAGSSDTDLDSDDDTLSDAQEVNVLHSNPASTDTDGDGLLDQDEAYFHGDINNPDTDGDTIDDGTEVWYWGIDPGSDDSDADGLTDPAELNTYHTYPWEPDSDFGGVNDGDEVARGTDPLKASDD